MAWRECLFRSFPSFFLAFRKLELRLSRSVNRGYYDLHRSASPVRRDLDNGTSAVHPGYCETLKVKEWGMR